MTDSHSDGLRPELTLLDATMINVGTIVASAIFIVPSAIAAGFTSTAPILLVWLIGGAVSICGAVCVAELGAAMPKAGGQFVYLREAYGPVWGYLYGWGCAVVVNPATIAAVAVGFAQYLAFFVPLSPAGQKVVAIASISALTLINCFGIKLGALTQNVLTLLKIGAVIAIILLCFGLKGGSVNNWLPFWSNQPIGSMVGPFGIAMVAVLYAYDGWIEVTYCGSELRHPERDMSRSIVWSTIIVIGLFVGVTMAMEYVLGRGGMAASSLVAADAMRVVMGSTGAALVTVAILVSTLGANHGVIFTSARIPYAMAREGVFFKWAARLDHRTDTPVIALIVQGVWSILLALTGKYQELTLYVVFVGFLFYAMSAGAVIILRRKAPDLPRPYRTWGYPVTPIVFILFSVYLVGSAIRETPKESAIGTFLLLLGLPIYWYYTKNPRFLALLPWLNR